MSQNETNHKSWREEAVLYALNYANHIWKPTKANAFHGYDENGILVNTPDMNYKSEKYDCGWWTIDQENRGIPYNWGGSSTIEEFNNGIVAGKYAGNVPDDRNNGVSKDCVGVDCSGLITNCWGVPKKLSTRSITEIAFSLDTLDSLLPSDVILKPGSHVMLFIDYDNKEKTCAKIVDASRSTGRVLLRTVELSGLYEKGYRGYRKIFT